MRIKRILITLLVALMMFSLVAFASAAEGNTSFDLKAEAISSAFLSDGVLNNTDEGVALELSLVVTKNPGVAVMSFDVNYDSTQMSYVEYKEGLFTSDNGKVTVNAEDGRIKVLLICGRYGEVDIAETGKLITLKFNIDGNFDGKNGPVSVNFGAIKAYNKSSTDPLSVTENVDYNFKVHHYAVIENGIQEPTCTLPGTTTYNCNVDGCNDVHVVTNASALGHSYADATCTEPQTCIRGCGSTIGEALGHTWSDATCTDPKTCSVCQATEGEALGHTWIDATCTTLKTCSVCQATEGVVAGHTWTDATCTTPKTCSVCQATEGEALGHKWTDATCTTPKTCSVCEATEGEALGHKWTDATCTVAKTCSVCQETEGDPLGHLNDVVLEKVEPTCTETGLTEGVKCSRCNVDTTPQIEIPVIPHQYEQDAYEAPTCTEPGWSIGSSCVVCDAVAIPQTKIPATGHNKKYNEITGKYDDLTPIVKEENRVEPTCVTKGSYDTATYCVTCNVEVSRETTSIDALGHDMIDDPYVAPTCTESGLEKGKHCSRCNDMTIPQEVIPALGHKWIDATCTTPKTCSVCQATEGNALGHDEVAHEAKAPTCTAIGWDAYVTCSRCDYTTYVEKAALGHDEVPHEAKAPTCTAVGWDAYVTCSRCDYTTLVEKAALGHDEVAHEAKAPTCTEIGWDAYVTCSRCDYTTYVEKAALGHTEEVLAKVEPTCTETGLTAGKKCSVCGTVLEAQEEIAALGHSYGEWVETKAPTTKAEGEETKTCSRCQDKQTQPIEKLPADNGWIVAVVIIVAVVVCAGVVVGVVFYKKKKATSK